MRAFISSHIGSRRAPVASSGAMGRERSVARSRRRCISERIPFNIRGLFVDHPLAHRTTPSMPLPLMELGCLEIVCIIVKVQSWGKIFSASGIHYAILLPFDEHRTLLHTLWTNIFILFTLLTNNFPVFCIQIHPLNTLPIPTCIWHVVISI